MNKINQRTGDKQSQRIGDEQDPLIFMILYHCKQEKFQNNPKWYSRNFNEQVYNLKVAIYNLFYTLEK